MKKIGIIQVGVLTAVLAGCTKLEKKQDAASTVGTLELKSKVQAIIESGGNVPIETVSYSYLNYTSQGSTVVFENPELEGAPVGIFFSVNLGDYEGIENPNEIPLGNFIAMHSPSYHPFVQQLDESLSYNMATTAPVEFVAFLVGVNAQHELFFSQMIRMNFAETNAASDDLIPGPGFNSETPEPAAIEGSTARSIANWNVVPRQIISDRFNIGVVAFHAEGIDSVLFSVDQGPWKSVSEKTYSERTKTVEYVATVNPALFGSARQVEVRAMAVPKKGHTRMLEPLLLTVDPMETVLRPEVYVSPAGNDVTGDGTLENPFQTISKAAEKLETVQGGKVDGGLIQLLAGTYEFPQTLERSVTTEETWMTIQAAPGVAREDVHVEYPIGKRIKTKYLRIHNLTLRDYIDFKPSSLVGELWVSNCDLYHNGMENEGPLSDRYGWVSSHLDIYGTDIEVHDAMQGFLNAKLLRGANIYNIAEDALGYARTVINTRIDNMDRVPFQDNPANVIIPHPDVWQAISGYGPLLKQYPTLEIVEDLENIILYNLKVTNSFAQCMYMAGFNEHIRGIAMINFACGAEPFMNAQIKDFDEINHFLVHHSSMTQGLLFRDGDAVENLSLRASALKRVYFSDMPYSEDYYVHTDFNHFQLFNFEFVPGQQTIGDPMWDEELRPLPGSPLIDVVPRFLLSDIDTEGSGVLRSEVTSVGAYD